MRTVFVLVAILLSVACAALPAIADASFTNDSTEAATKLHIVFDRRVEIVDISGFLNIWPRTLDEHFTLSGGHLNPGAKVSLRWEPASAQVIEATWEYPALIDRGPIEEHPLMHTTTLSISVQGRDGIAVEIQATRHLSNRVVPFHVTYELAGMPPGWTAVWDMNDKADSDLDGQYCNDDDAYGVTAQYIYSTNRTPYTVTAYLADDQGNVSVWEDAISFPLQNNEKITLDPNCFGCSMQSVLWEVHSGDPNDPNWTLFGSEGSNTFLMPIYPGTARVTCRAQADSSDREFSSEIYVFSDTPDLMEYRGIAFSTRLMDPRIPLSHVSKVFESLVAIGCNYVTLPVWWRYEIVDGEYRFFNRQTAEYDPWLWGDRDTTHDERLVALIELAHRENLAVNLFLLINPAPGTATERNEAFPSDGFYYGSNGYLAFAEHYADIARQTNTELFTATSEMRTEPTEARPYLEELFQLLDRSLDSTKFTVEVYWEAGGWPVPYPFPEDEDYGVPLDQLALLGFSSYNAIAATSTSGIVEMQQIVDGQQFEAYRRVHGAENGDHLGIVTTEIGLMKCDGCTSYWNPNELIESGTAEKDLEEQRRGIAAWMRASCDAIDRGEDWMRGIFWNVIAPGIDSERPTLAYALNGTPALEEIYTFWSSEPRELPSIPYIESQYRVTYVIDESQDVRQADCAAFTMTEIQGFEDRTQLERARILGMSIPEPRTNPNTPDLNTLTAGLDSLAAAGSASLRLQYDNKVGREGSAILVLPVTVANWDGAQVLSLACRRSDLRIGLALVVYEGAFHDGGSAYSQRLPLKSVGEWEEVCLLLDTFITPRPTEGDAFLCSADSEKLDNWNVGIFLYSTDDAPVAGTVWLDSLSLGHGGEAEGPQVSPVTTAAAEVDTLPESPIDDHAVQENFLADSSSSSALVADSEWLFLGDGTVQDRPSIYRMGGAQPDPFYCDGSLWGPMHMGDDQAWHFDIEKLVTYSVQAKPFHAKDHMEIFYEWLPELDRETAVIDLWGNPVQWDHDWTLLKCDYHHNVLHPALRERAKQRLELLVDSGFPGVTLDILDTSFLISYGGTYDAWTEEAFRTYLLQIKTADELDLLTGERIDESFSLSEWVIRNGLADQWLKPPYHPLAREYILFLLHEEQAMFAELVQHAKTYAQCTYNRDFEIGANAWLGLGRLGRITPSLDYVAREVFAPFGYYSHHRPLTELLQAMKPGMPVTYHLEVRDALDEGVFPRGSLRNLVPWQASMMWASGASVLLGDTLLQVDSTMTYGPTARYDLDTVRLFSKFLGNHRALFDAEGERARVAVIYDEASSLNSGLFIDRGFDEWEGRVLNGVAKVFYETGILFDFVYVPDPRFSNDRIDSAMLRDYAVIVVPNAHSMPAYASELIADYVLDGGSVVATGETGMFDVDFNPTPSALGQMLVSGSALQGQGLLYHTEDVGVQRSESYSESANLLLNFVTARVSPTVQIDEEGIYSFVRRSGESWIIHFVNTSYSKSEDDVPFLTDVQIDVRGADLPRSPIGLWLEPGSKAAVTVSLTQVSSGLYATLPSLHIAGILVVLPGDLSSGLDPASASTVVLNEGETVSLSVENLEAYGRVVNWSIGGAPCISQAIEGSPRIDLVAEQPLDGEIPIVCTDAATGTVYGAWIAIPPESEETWALQAQSAYQLPLSQYELAESWLHGTALEVFLEKYSVQPEPYLFDSVEWDALPPLLRWTVAHDLHFSTWSFASDEAVDTPELAEEFEGLGWHVHTIHAAILPEGLAIEVEMWTDDQVSADPLVDHVLGLGETQSLQVRPGAGMVGMYGLLGSGWWSPGPLLRIAESAYRVLIPSDVWQQYLVLDEETLPIQTSFSVAYRGKQSHHFVWYPRHGYLKNLLDGSPIGEHTEASIDDEDPEAPPAEPGTAETSAEESNPADDHTSEDDCIERYGTDFQPADLVAIDGFSPGTVPIGWWYTASRIDGEWQYTELNPRQDQPRVTYQYPEDGSSGWLHLQMSGPTDLSDCDGLQIQLRTTPSTSVMVEIHTGCNDSDEWVHWALPSRIECGSESTVVRVPFSCLLAIDGASTRPDAIPSQCIRVVAFILDEEGVELTVDSVHAY